MVDVSIVSGRVFWYEQYANRPHLEVVLEGQPAYSDFRWTKYSVAAEPRPRRHGNGLYAAETYGDFYFAELGGECTWLSYIGPSEGFGGRVFKLTMKDGSKVELKGPWASRGSIANRLGLGPLVDVVVVGDPPMGSALLHTLVEEALPRIAVPDYEPRDWGTKELIEERVVRFPAGTRAALRRVDSTFHPGEYSYEPYAVLPDGTPWVKPS